MNSNLEINLERILILGTTLLNMLYDNLVHSIGTIEYWVIDIIFIVHMGLVTTHIGIETRCGWIGYGDMMVGTHGVHLIGGHHLDMIDGDITYTMVGIIMDGVIMDTTVMDGITMDGIITVKIIGTEDEVETMCHTSIDEEVVV
tara:strand:- start:60 stop:491 length:432 start_codon:yes stop_codon:yes gene_type:complete